MKLGLATFGGIGDAASGSGINFDFTTAILPAAITFTRASIGTYNSSGNILTTAGSNAARFNYVSGVANLLIEGSATNLFAQSNSFTTTPWATAIGAVLTAAQFVSPDGANTGWTMTSGSGYGYCYQPINLSNIPYMCSIWAKQITGDALVGLTLNNVNTTIVPSATLTRVSSAITPLAGYTSCYFQVVTGNSGYVQGYYGIQVETGSVMTSYIPTTTAAVTRAADSATFTIPAGVSQLVYTFDDNSTQTVAVSPGSYTIPTNLNRPNIKSIQSIQSVFGFDFTTGSLPAGITFTRASIGTYFNSGNILTTASSNVARFNYVGGVSCLLIEPAATNLLLQSNNFSNASWPAGGSPVLTSAQFISPDGTNNGWSMTSGIGQGVIYQIYSWLNIPYTLSIWAKRIIGSSPIELLTDGASSGGIVTSATITRFSFTGTPSDTTGVAFRLPVPSGSTNGIYGGQLETGSKATSYIPTTTAAVTRAADSATFTISAGVSQLVYTFDDNSTQTVSVSPGSYTIPTNLNRANIKTIGLTVLQRAFAM
jgi:hypothetical protein